MARVWAQMEGLCIRNLYLTSKMGSRWWVGGVSGSRGGWWVKICPEGLWKLGWNDALVRILPIVRDVTYTILWCIVRVYRRYTRIKFLIENES